MIRCPVLRCRIQVKTKNGLWVHLMHGHRKDQLADSLINIWLALPPGLRDLDRWQLGTGLVQLCLRPVHHSGRPHKPGLFRRS